MGYRLKKDELVGHGIRRIAREQIDKAIAELTEHDGDRHDAVHQARKRFKKIRGVVRLVRPAMGKAYSRENAWFRDTGKELSGLRDAEAVVETLDRLREVFDGRDDARLLSRVREAMVNRRRGVVEQIGDLDDRMVEIAESLRGARDRVGDWRLSEDGFGAVEGGLVKTYRRGRKARAVAYREMTPEAFHEWRKRVKYHWHHMRLLQNIWPGPMRTRRRETRNLAELLGHSHDLAVFQSLLRGSPEQFGGEHDVQVVLGLAERRQADLRAEALPLGLRVFAEKPGCISSRMGGYWRAWTHATRP